MNMPRANTAGEGASVAELFNDPQALRRLYQPSADPTSEPVANFPLLYYEEFLRQIERAGVVVITYRDLFRGSDDWAYRSNYEGEYRHWRKKVRDPRKTYLLIQHDVDNRPDFTKRMVAMEAVYGVRSNILLFWERFSRRGEPAPYDVDHAFFQESERRGFVIGYHQNAFALAGFDMERAIDRYRSDVKNLRRYYDIDFVVPHGGVGKVLQDRMYHNIDVPMPSELEGNLRWVGNRHSVVFNDRWSDGGLQKTRDPKRISTFDIIQRFLRLLKTGTRNFCLVHPQRWGYNVDIHQNLLLAREPWYRELVARYGL